jgi:hypothetical protein
MTLNVTGTTPVTLTTPATGTYIVNKGATLVLEDGTAPGSVIVDEGGTVAISPTTATPSYSATSDIFLLNSSVLAFESLAFINQATAERIHLDATSVIAIAGVPSETPAFLWAENPTTNGLADVNGYLSVTFSGAPPDLLNATAGFPGTTLPTWTFGEVAPAPGATGYTGVIAENSNTILSTLINKIANV